MASDQVKNHREVHLRRPAKPQTVQFVTPLVTPRTTNCKISTYYKHDTPNFKFFKKFSKNFSFFTKNNLFFCFKTKY